MIKMSWQEIIKAVTLPQANKDSWVEILSSEENTRKFMNSVRNGQVSSAGLKNTLSFLRNGSSAKNLENFSSIDYDEEEIVNRYNEIKPRLIYLLENKTNRNLGVSVRHGQLAGEALTIENNEKVYELLDALVEANPSNVTVNSDMGKYLLSIEKYFVEHRVQFRRMKNTLVAKYGEFFSNWPIPGIAISTPSVPDPKDPNRRMTNPAYQEEWWDEDGEDRRLKTLIKLFKDATPPTIRYTSNTLDAELTHTYYTTIAKHNRLLIPDDLQDYDLFVSSKRLKMMNPNLLLILIEDNPFITVDKQGADKLADRDKPIAGGVAAQKDKKQYQTMLESVSGRGMLFTEDGYDLLEDTLNDYEENEEQAKNSDGNFSAKEQRDLKLLRGFLSLSTNTIEYDGEDYINVVASPATINKINKVFGAEIEAVYAEIPSELRVGEVKTPKKASTTTEEVLGDIDLGNLSGDIEPELSLINLLNVIHEADEALDLNSFTDNTFQEFDNATSAIRETIVEITQEKIDDIVQSPTNYRKLKPIKSAEFTSEGEGEDITRVQTKTGFTVFDALVNKELITEVSA
tara:strand:- start:2207 stop:3922 length:1716 start_codon:yes stop_codon:yes gene_type:complete